MSEHPIVPPPELVQKWALIEDVSIAPSWMLNNLATRAAQWGADCELDACCEWFQEFYKTESWVKHDLKYFRQARRLKPSLKQQALAQLDAIQLDLDNSNIFGANTDTIRRALESLPD